jgi:hypothetical protein
MKVAIYSDLHIEFGEFVPPEINVDLVILSLPILTKLLIEKV